MESGMIKRDVSNEGVAQILQSSRVLHSRHATVYPASNSHAATFKMPTAKWRMAASRRLFVIPLMADSGQPGQGLSFVA